MAIDFRTFVNRAGRGGLNAGVLGWPGWAKMLLAVPMVPGLLLLALSLLAVLASLAALFVLTVPVYSLLNRVLSVRKSQEAYRSPGSKRVDAVIRDA